MGRGGYFPPPREAGDDLFHVRARRWVHECTRRRHRDHQPQPATQASVFCPTDIVARRAVEEGGEVEGLDLAGAGSRVPKTEAQNLRFSLEAVTAALSPSAWAA